MLAAVVLMEYYAKSKNGLCRTMQDYAEAVLGMQIRGCH